MTRWRRLLRRLGATMTLLVGATVSIVATPQPAGATVPAWSITATSPAVPVSSSGVACPTATTCFAADQTQGGISVVRATTDAGTTWSTVATMGTTVSLASIACATTTACVAIDGAGDATVTTDDGWSTFRVHTVPRHLSLYNLVCTTARFCSASGTDSGPTPWFLTSLDGGATWTVRAVPHDADGFFNGNGFLAPLTCTDRVDCIIGGETDTSVGGRFQWYATLFRTSNGGRTWSDVRLPRWVGNVASLTCAGARCAAAGGTSQQPFFGGQGVVLTSLDGGATWHAKLRTSAVQGLASIACPSPGSCVALGESGYLEVIAETTTDGGATWKRHVVANRIGVSGDDVTCQSVHLCVATAVQSDAPLSVSTNGGATWRGSDSGAAAPVIRSLVCPVAGTCEGIAAPTHFSPPGVAPVTVVRTINGGVTWTTQTLSGSSGFAGSLTCPTVSVCMLTDYFAGALFVTVDGGTTWAKHRFASGVEPDTVACASATACVLAGFDASTSTGAVLYTSDGGTTWTAGTVPSLPSGDFSILLDATCPSATTCYLDGLVDDSQSAVATFLTTTDGGATWSSVSLPGQGSSGSTDIPGTISCSSTTTCVSVAENADAQGIVPATSVAVFVTTDGGASWNEAHTVGAAIQLSSNVACVAGGWCELIGTDPTTGSAYALTSTDGGITWTAAAMPTGWYWSRSLACTGVNQCVSTGIVTSGGTGVATLS